MKANAKPSQERRGPFEIEICFFAIGENFIRLKGGDGIYQTLRQLTFRCGGCGQPVEEVKMDQHANDHYDRLRAQ